QEGLDEVRVVRAPGRGGLSAGLLPGGRPAAGSHCLAARVLRRDPGGAVAVVAAWSTTAPADGRRDARRTGRTDAGTGRVRSASDRPRRRAVGAAGRRRTGRLLR